MKNYVYTRLKKAHQSLCLILRRFQQLPIHAIKEPLRDDDTLLRPEEIVFLICVEANRLEPQAHLLCSSIRIFAGRYKDVPIVAVSPRPNLALSMASQQRLHALGVTYVSQLLNDTGSTYGTINRIVVGAWAEKSLRQPYLVVLDTDTMFVSEPRFVRADVGVRAVDMKGSASSGAGDPLDQYWNTLCEIAGIKISQLPMIDTTVDHVKIRASYNGGFTVVRRDLGILQQTKDIFFSSLQKNHRPLAGAGVNIKASTGHVGIEASEWWGSSQAALSIAIWSRTSDVHIYDSRYNIPAHLLLDSDAHWPLPQDIGPVLIHNHYLAEPEHQEQFCEVMRRLNCTPEALGWIEQGRIAFDEMKNDDVCLCTLAINEPYRSLARTLYKDAPDMPWVILTDTPDDFSDLSVRAISHVPTGPMAVDYLARLLPTGQNRGAAAYHDKRFALIAALAQHHTAIFLDADSRIKGALRFKAFPPGICVLPVVRRSIAEHLQATGSWRLPAFVALAEHLTGHADILQYASWCHESCVAITKDGLESRFFEIWDRAAGFMQSLEVYSGEGGVIGLAAAITGWSVNYDTLADMGAIFDHAGGGPKPLPILA